MKILVDEMPKEPKDCPYSHTFLGEYVFCNFRDNTPDFRCDNTSKCIYFREKRITNDEN